MVQPSVLLARDGSAAEVDCLSTDVHRHHSDIPKCQTIVALQVSAPPLQGSPGRMTAARQKEGRKEGVVCVCVCVCAEVTEVYDTMPCLPIVSDRAATEGSKYF